MPHEQAVIVTRDARCPARVFMPSDGRGGPAVLFFTDEGGIMPAVPGTAGRLVEAGNVVLMSELFYRHAHYGPFSSKEIFQRRRARNPAATDGDDRQP